MLLLLTLAIRSSVHIHVLTLIVVFEACNRITVVRRMAVSVVQTLDGQNHLIGFGENRGERKEEAARENQRVEKSIDDTKQCII